MSPSVCLATQHPNVGGGVSSMANAVVQHARQHGLSPSMLFPSKSVGDVIRHKPAAGLPCPGLHYRSVPYLHLLNFWLPAITARRALRSFDIHHAVGGFSLPGLPLYLNGHRYVCWVATTLKDEWYARYQWHDLSYRNIPSHANVPFLPLLYRYEKRILERSEHVFALSEYTAGCLRRHVGLTNPNVEVMPYLVDTDHFTPNGESALPDQPYILFCGRAHDCRKNVHLLLRAFARVRRQFPKLMLLVAGPKPERARIWRLIDQLDLRSHILFLGSISQAELPAYYRGARLKVLSSTQEGLAIVLLEAMACGVPVVSTRCGGPEEIVVDGQTGALVENRSAEQLAEAICCLLSDDQHRAEMGHAARRRILERYSLQEVGYRFVDRYRAIYPQLFPTAARTTTGRLSAEGSFG